MHIETKDKTPPAPEPQKQTGPGDDTKKKDDGTTSGGPRQRG